MLWGVPPQPLVIRTLWEERRSSRVLQLHMRMDSIHESDGQKYGGEVEYLGSDQWRRDLRKVQKQQRKAAIADQLRKTDISAVVPVNMNTFIHLEALEQTFFWKVVLIYVSAGTAPPLHWTTAVFPSPSDSAHLCSSQCVSWRRPSPPLSQLKSICQDTIGLPPQLCCFWKGDPSAPLALPLGWWKETKETHNWGIYHFSST